MDAIFLAIAFYLLYRFITGFLIPVFRNTRQVRQQFNQMNGQAGKEHSERPGESAQNTTPDKGRTHAQPNTSKVGEYIDFEDVK